VDRDREDSIFRRCTWALKSYQWVKTAQLLVCICRILDRVKSSIGDKQYNTWINLWVSCRPHNHYDCCSKAVKNSSSWSWIYGTAEYIVNETADNESVSDKWLTMQCYIHLSDLEITHQSWLELHLWKHVNGFWWWLHRYNKLRPEFMAKFNVLEHHSETLKSWKLVTKSLTNFF